MKKRGSLIDEVITDVRFAVRRCADRHRSAAGDSWPVPDYLRNLHFGNRNVPRYLPPVSVKIAAFEIHSTVGVGRVLRSTRSITMSGSSDVLPGRLANVAQAAYASTHTAAIHRCGFAQKVLATFSNLLPVRTSLSAGNQPKARAVAGLWFAEKLLQTK